MVTKDKTFLETLEEHCTYCPESLFEVAKALLSVEGHLDYNTKYELEYLLKAYVIAIAKEDPEGLGSILTKFPLTDESNTTVEEDGINLYNKVIDYPDQISSDIVDKLKAMVEAKHTPSHDTAETPKKKKLPKKISTSYSVKEQGLESVKEALMMDRMTISKPPVDMAGQEDLIVEAKVIRLASGSTDGSVWNVRMIVSGHTQSGRYFSDDVLQEAIPLFEGTRSYMNHPPEDYNGGDRPINTLVGWYDNVTLKEGDGLYADWHILQVLTALACRYGDLVQNLLGSADLRYDQRTAKQRSRQQAAPIAVNLVSYCTRDRIDFWRRGSDEPSCFLAHLRSPLETIGISWPAVQSIARHRMIRIHFPEQVNVR